MSKISAVLHQIHSGAKVRIVLDSYGQKKVEVTRAWLPLRRFVRLNRDEISLVEVALNARPRRGKQSVAVKI